MTDVNPWSKTDYVGNIKIIKATIEINVPTGPLQEILSVTDGTSNTILIGEKSMGPQLCNTVGWLWDDPIFANGGAGGVVRSGTTVPRDAIAIKFGNKWGSAQPEGAHLRFLDGSMHMITYDISNNGHLARKEWVWCCRTARGACQLPWPEGRTGGTQSTFVAESGAIR